MEIQEFYDSLDSNGEQEMFDLITDNSEKLKEFINIEDINDELKEEFIEHHYPGEILEPSPHSGFEIELKEVLMKIWENKDNLIVDRSVMDKLNKIANQ